MGRKKNKRPSVGGGQNSPGGPPSIPPTAPSAGGQHPQEPNHGWDRKGIYSPFGVIGGLIVYAIGPELWIQAAALALAAAIAIFWVLRSPISRGWHWFGKAIAIVVVVLLTAFPAKMLYAKHLAEVGSPDDLLATFAVSDPQQLGAGEIDFKVNFINRGSRAVTIKDVGSFVAYRMADAFHMVPPCSISNLRPESVDIWYGIVGLHKGSRLGTDDLTLYSALRSTLDSSAGVNIQAKSNHTVSAHVRGLDISHNRGGADETYLCPIIRYSDFDGTDRVVVCDAYHFRKDEDRTRYPGSTNKPVRLLPHAENSQCVSDDVPADTHVVSKEEQALP